MNTTEAIIHMPRCLIAHDFGVVLGWKGIDTGPRVRREYRAGRPDRCVAAAELVVLVA